MSQPKNKKLKLESQATENDGGSLDLTAPMPEAAPDTRIAGNSPSTSFLKLNRDERQIVALLLLVKIVFFIFGVMSYHVWMDQAVTGKFGWLEIWNRWDAPHYLTLAEFGYSAVGERRFTMVFYPLFPWMIRAFSFLFGNFLFSAFVISTLASLVAGVMLYRLVRLDCSRAVARRAVWFLFIFPTSYFLHIGYSESLFLALVLGCLYAARRERWQTAGLLAALCCMSRGPGVAIIPALCVEAAHRFWLERRWRWDWLWIAQAPLGFLVYLLVNYKVTGDPFAFMAIAREHFYVSLSWPWVSIGQAISALDRNPASAEMIGAQVLIFMALSLIAVVVSWIKLRPMASAWITANWLLVTAMSFSISFPRFTLMMFPIHVLMAKLAGNRSWRGAITVWALLNLGLFASLFVRGHWAF